MDWVDLVPVATLLILVGIPGVLGFAVGVAFPKHPRISLGIGGLLWLTWWLFNGWLSKDDVDRTAAIVISGILGLIPLASFLLGRAWGSQVRGRRSASARTRSA